MQQSAFSPLQILRRTLSSKKIRFMMAGGLNTVVDFASFNLLIFVFGAGFWMANILSTSIAMILSFILNKQAIFKDGTGFKPAQLAAFIAVTATGLWGMQTVAVVGIIHILQPVAHLMLDHTPYASAVHWLVPNVSKALAIVLSAVWNYLWYDRVIFAHTPEAAEIAEKTAEII